MDQRRPQPSSSFMNTPDVGTSSSAHSQIPLSIQTDYTLPSSYSHIMVNDVPDLLYDYEQYESGCTASPPSAASSSQMPTPLYDWEIPLPMENSPGLSVRQKPEATGYSLDQWSSSSCDWDYHPSSTYGYSDEFDWEQNLLDDPTSYNHPSTAPTHCDSHSQSIFSKSYSSASATYDTQHHTQFNSATSSSPAGSSTGSTISPSILEFAQSASSTAASTPTSAVSHLRPAQLHHPRPSRRIPIISLAELASASEEVLQKRGFKAAPKPQILSPLPIDCHEFGPTFGSCYNPSSQPYLPSFPSGVRREVAAITCSCGCMGSYAV